MISIVIPYYKNEKSEEYLKRCIASIQSQSYKDYEIVISEVVGGASNNTNAGVKKAKVDMVKILCMDDHFTSEHSLQTIVDNFTGEWLVHGVSNNKNPYYTGDILQGNNKLGGLSSIAFKRNCFIPFDESLVWLFDCKWHKQMYDKYGEPKIVNGDIVTIQEGGDQATSKITKEIKLSEIYKLTNV
jgi:glycosyltransferase involved in cell wall biosynthesis